MKKFFTFIMFITAAAAGFCSTYDIKTDPVLKTMEAEIKRSLGKLKKANPPVYFLSYTTTQSEVYVLRSVLGGQAYENKSKNNQLDTEVRVGNRKMDNTRKIKENSYDVWFGSASGSASAPLDYNAKNLQKTLWLQTEEAVKKAQETYLKVKTNAQTASERSDNSDDFSAPLPPQSYYESAQMPSFDTQELKSRLNEYSAMFKGHGFIMSSAVTFNITIENAHYVNSEGTRIKQPSILMRLSYEAASRNEDGMELKRSKSYDFIDLKDMPSPQQVKQDIITSIEELKTLQKAPFAEPFHGPVILKNRATGVFFHEILGHRVEGHRQKDDDFGQTFTGKLNRQVISPIISVYDNPTLKEYNGVPLRGHYLYDDEGVPAQNVTIIKDGVLKNFLMGRTPVNNFPQSNGHGRKAPGKSVVSRMGTTIVEASKTISFDELRAMLIEEIKKQNKSYGLIIEDISGGFTNTDTYGPQSFKVQPLLVYKVYADSRPDEIIRGADIVGTPLSSFNKIMAAANDYDIFNGSCGAESGWVPVSAIAPSVLISEMEIEKIEKSYDSLPLLPPPSASTATTVKKGAK
ncbi:MAG: TldD/PmbA family protein [Endomicrobium sp.]|jgi:TldD protein|nr:TldD/PmbA family protein [Endomicrobium sp.]